MRRYLVDLNVVLDVALQRGPYLEPATAIWSAIEAGKLVGFLTAHAVTTAFYIARRQLGAALAYSLLSDLTTVFRVAAVDDEVIRRALTLRLADFDDAVTAAAAEAAGCEAIVTGHPAAFASAPIRAISPALGLAGLDSEVHEPQVAYRVFPRRRRRSSARS